MLKTPQLPSAKGAIASAATSAKVDASLDLSAVCRNHLCSILNGHSLKLQQSSLQIICCRQGIRCTVQVDISPIALLGRVVGYLTATNCPGPAAAFSGAAKNPAGGASVADLWQIWQ
jgi:hypothetical protein